MSEKGFSIDEILKELRSGSTTDDIRADYQNYNPDHLVDELLGKTTPLPTTQAPTTSGQKNAPFIKEQAAATSEIFSAAPAREIPSTNAEDAVLKPEKAVGQSEPAEVIKEEAVEAQAPVESTPEEPASAEQVESAEQLEQERLREMMLSTAHLRYISLRKNRKQKVQGFVLKDELNGTPDVELDVDDGGENPLHLSSVDLESEDQPPKLEFLVDDEPDFDSESDFDLEPDFVEEEYTDASQKDGIFRRLKLLTQQAKQRCFGLGALFVISLIFVFLTKTDGAPSFLSRIESPLIYAGIQFVLLLVGGILCYEVLLDGVKSLFRWELTKRTPYALAMLSSLLAGLVFLIFPKALTDSSVEFYVPLCLMCLFALPFGQYLTTKRMLLNFPVVAESDPKCAVCVVDNQKLAEDFTKDAVEEPFLVHNRKTPFLSHFMSESLSEDISDRLPNKTIPILLGAAVVSAIFAVIMGDGAFTAITAFNAVLLLGAGMIPAFFCNYPLFHAAKNLTRLGGAVLGNRAVERFAEANAVALSANEIFKGSDVTLYGIKTFSDVGIDRVILDAACVLSESKSILGEVFMNIIDHRLDYLDEVENVLYEDGMGISAWVGDRRVLIGSRELMIHHNISVPNREYEDKYVANERQLIYLATDGDLSAVFIIGLECSADIANLIMGLYSNSVTAIVKTVDPIITGPLLAKVFHLPEETFRVIPSRLHRELDKLVTTDEPENAGVCNDGHLASYLYSFLLSKGLQRSVDYGKMVNIFSMALGVLLVVGFTAIHGLGQLGSLTLCLYEAISLGVCYLIQKLTRL